MILKDIKDEDFVNYKKPSMVIGFPYCSFKCDKECGRAVCQNSPLAQEPDIHISFSKIAERYINNPITEAIVFQGLEPFDSFEDMICLVDYIREIAKCDDDIVIYTGYKKEEIPFFIEVLKEFKNIIVKYGRYIPDQNPHYDEVLGVNLASDNQYAERL